MNLNIALEHGQRQLQWSYLGRIWVFLTGFFQYIQLANSTSWHITVTTHNPKMYHHGGTDKEPI